MSDSKRFSHFHHNIPLSLERWTKYNVSNNRSFRRKIMSSRGIFILAITWIVMSPFWFWAENIALGIIWLCGGVIELFIALVRCNKKRRKASKFQFIGMIQQLFLHGKKRIRRERKKYLWNGKLNKTGQNITNHIEKTGQNRYC